MPDAVNHANPPIGARYNRLTVLAFAWLDKNNKTFWHVRCACGRDAYMRACNIIRGRSTQCKFCGWEATHRSGRPAVHGARDVGFARMFASGITVTSIAALHRVERGTVSGAIDRLRRRGIEVSRARL